MALLHRVLEKNAHAKRVKSLTTSVVSLSKHERALCLFNPNHSNRFSIRTLQRTSFDMLNFENHQNIPKSSF